MVLGQAPVVTPLAGQPPIGFPSTLEPLRIEGGAIAWRNPDYWVAWTDRRRGYDVPSAPVDVWVGQWNENTQTLSQVSSRLTGFLSDVKLAVSRTDSRLYVVRSDDAGVQVVATSLVGATTQSPLVATPAAVNGIAVAAVENEFLLAVRRDGQVNLFRESSMPQQLTTGISVRDLRVTGADGGFLVSFIDSGGPRAGLVPLLQFTLPSAQILMLGSTPGQLAPLPIEPPSFVTSDTNGVRLQLVDAGVFRSQAVPLLGLQPMLVSTVQSSTRAVIVNGSGVATVPSGGGVSFVSTFDAGLPLGLAVHDNTGTLLASYEGAATIRRFDVASGGQPNVSMLPALLKTTAPQRSPTAIWSAAANQFLMAWEQRSPAGFEVLITRIDRDGGSSALPQRVAAAGHSPRLLDGPDGGGVALRLQVPPDAGPQTTYSNVNSATLELVATFRNDSVPTQALFWPSFVSWTPTNPTTAQGGSVLLTQAPRCVAVAGGVAWFSGVKNNQLVITPVPSGAPLIIATPMDDDSSGCAAVGRDGTVLVVARAGSTVQLAHVDPVQQQVLAQPNLAPATGDPVVTALGDGFLVAWPQGQNIVAHLVRSPPFRLTSLNLNPGMGVVSELVATSSPAGEALLAWHAFDADGGVHSVWARVLSVPGFAPGVDGGVIDAGSGVIDSGVVVPVNDAGSGVIDSGVVPVNDAGPGVIDAGPPDTTIDAGAADAGRVDGGATDGGGTGTAQFVPVCGCSSVDGRLVALLALLLALTRRRGREAAPGVFR